MPLTLSLSHRFRRKSRIAPSPKQSLLAHWLSSFQWSGFCIGLWSSVPAWVVFQWNFWSFHWKSQPCCVEGELHKALSVEASTFLLALANSSIETKRVISGWAVNWAFSLHFCLTKLFWPTAVLFLYMCSCVQTPACSKLFWMNMLSWLSTDSSGCFKPWVQSATCACAMTLPSTIRPWHYLVARHLPFSMLQREMQSQSL